MAAASVALTGGLEFAPRERGGLRPVAGGQQPPHEERQQRSLHTLQRARPSCAPHQAHKTRRSICGAPAPGGALGPAMAHAGGQAAAVTMAAGLATLHSLQLRPSCLGAATSVTGAVTGAAVTAAAAATAAVELGAPASMRVAIGAKSPSGAQPQLQQQLQQPQLQPQLQQHQLPQQLAHKTAAASSSPVASRRAASQPIVATSASIQRAPLKPGPASSPATTNSRLRQGILYARRHQYRVASTPPAGSLQSPPLTSRAPRDPQADSCAVVVAATKTAPRRPLSDHATPDDPRAAAAAAALPHRNSRAQRLASARSHSSLRKSPGRSFGRTASKFSFTSSDSSLSSSASALKRAKASPTLQLAAKSATSHQHRSAGARARRAPHHSQDRAQATSRAHSPSSSALLHQAAHRGALPRQQRSAIATATGSVAATAAIGASAGGAGFAARRRAAIAPEPVVLLLGSAAAPGSTTIRRGCQRLAAAPRPGRLATLLSSIGRPGAQPIPSSGSSRAARSPLISARKPAASSGALLASGRQDPSAVQASRSPLHYRHNQRQPHTHHNQAPQPATTTSDHSRRHPISCAVVAPAASDAATAAKAAAAATAAAPSEQQSARTTHTRLAAQAEPTARAAAETVPETRAASAATTTSAASALPAPNSGTPPVSAVAAPLASRSQETNELAHLVRSSNDDPDQHQNHQNICRPFHSSPTPEGAHFNSSSSSHRQAPITQRAPAIANPSQASQPPPPRTIAPNLVANKEDMELFYPPPTSKLSPLANIFDNNRTPPTLCRRNSQPLSPQPAHPNPKLSAGLPAVAIRLEPISDFYDLDARPFARGKFAQVKRCINKASKQCFAAKCIKKRRRLVDIRHEILLEIEALSLSHYTERIVKLYEVFETSNEIILVLEMAMGGELQKILDEEVEIEEPIVKRMVKQILEGLVELHKSEIAHLDIKPQNLLLTEEFPKGDIKLCDFGMSRRITQDCELREICGTPDYVAPEILRYDPITLNTDMWSLGVLTYVLLSGYSPFSSDDKQQTFCNITQATLDFPPDIFGKISSEAIDFVSKLIVLNPQDRLSSQQARTHPWLLN